MQARTLPWKLTRMAETAAEGLLAPRWGAPSALTASDCHAGPTRLLQVLVQGRTQGLQPMLHRSWPGKCWTTLCIGLSRSCMAISGKQDEAAVAGLGAAC